MNELGYPAGSTMILAGTSGGLFLLTSQDRIQWNVQATSLAGADVQVFYAICDPRNRYRIFASDKRAATGAHLRYSDDFGASWQDPRQSIQFPEESGITLSDIWYIEPGRASEPQTLYAGTGPASLWSSMDAGLTWHINRALYQKYQQEHWTNGSIGSCLHSIIADPTRPERMWLGISGAGSLRSEDHGQSWQTINQLARAEAYGSTKIDHSSHRLLQHTIEPDILYQQNRCGLYRSQDGGSLWTNITHNLPSTFGFPLAIDNNHPDTLFTLVVDPMHRTNISEQFTVYRSQNSGTSWQALTRGLPSGPDVHIKVLRHGMCTDTQNPSGTYIGTMDGQIFASHNNGDTWQQIARHLPAIYSLTTTILP